jgi:hypothetical protein
MLHKLLLVECIEMACKSLCHYWVYHWLGCSWATVQLEGLIGLLICGLKFELLWLIVRDSINEY